MCIVGAGYTGLWTAYYLKRARPGLRVVVLEKEFAGFGASGRNGGWLVAELAGSPERYAKRARPRGGRSRCSRRCTRPSTRSSTVAAARGHRRRHRQGRRAQRRAPTPPSPRGCAAARRRRATGAGPRRTCGCSARRSAAAGATSRARSAASGSPHCARIQPAKLVAGPGRAVESARAWTIYERTTVTEIRPATRRRHRPTARSRADYVLRATEGFTAGARGPAPDLAADEQLDDRHRAAAARPCGTRSAGRGSETAGRHAPTRTCTPSAPPTAGSRSAAAASRTGTARAWTDRGPHPAATDRRARGDARHGCSPPRPAPGRPRLVRRARRAARLVLHRRAGPRHRPRLGRRLRRARVATTNLAGRTLRDLVLREDTELTGPALGRPQGTRAGSPSRCAGSACSHVHAVPRGGPAGRTPGAPVLRLRAARRSHLRPLISRPVVA